MSRNPDRNDVKFPELSDEMKAIFDYINAEVGELDYELFEGIIHEVEEVIDNAVIDCDPSPKMILHEPYRTVRNKMSHTFYNY